MEAALIRMLLGTAFVGMQLSPCALVVAYDKSLYERVLGRDPGICGAWYRNPNKTEEIMDCVLKKVSTPVKDKWTNYMDDNCLTITELVSEICDLRSIMPSSFINYETEILTKRYNDEAESAGIACTTDITGWTTQSPPKTAPPRVRGPR
uniref:Putative isac anti-complement n=1 Tax=Ixodes ricinus TaxID=34613 RepID=A0A0K8RAM8_IXORI